MYRKFLPVGQGAFYVECFGCPGKEAINVVYDCGSLSAVRLVWKRIGQCFAHREKIHAVFLSHFDEDHVNGLECLLEWCRIENIFFPLLTEEDKLWLRLGHLVNHAFANEKAFWLRFALDPLKTISQMDLEHRPCLCPVRAEDGEDERAEFRELSEYMVSRSDVIKVIRSGDDVSEIIFGPPQNDSESSWLYIPFHFREKVRREKLKALLEEHLGTCDLKELLRRLNSDPRYRREIKKVYRYVPGSLNTNSMTLFSGVKSENVSQCSMKGGCADLKFNIEPGCLYLGDYDAAGPRKWQELENAYKNYFPYIGCLQVPHHGSKANFNSGLSGIGKCYLYVISAGRKNKYHHPHGSVMKQILLAGKQPAIVTEEDESKIELQVLP